MIFLDLLLMVNDRDGTMVDDAINLPWAIGHVQRLYIWVLIV